MQENLSLDQLILQLEEVGAVKFGEFTLKSGLSSPVYFDLRVLVSYPKLLDTVASLLLQLVDRRDCVLCGVPYTALPIATLMSVKADVGMVVRRKEAKDYGTKKMVEGRWSDNQNCVIVEDVVTSGGSVKETADLLRNHGMEVTDCVVLLNREQGAIENLTKSGIKVKSLVSVSKVLEVLLREGRITEDTVTSVKSFISNNQTQGVEKVRDVMRLDFSSRIASVKNEVTKRLMSTMIRKQSNLCVAVDAQRAAEVLALVRKVGGSAVVIKLHADLVEDWNHQTEVELKNLSQELDFLLFEDRKLADIGNTVRLQTSRFSSWADLVTVHGLPGRGVVEGVKEGSKASPVGVVIVSEMSNSGNLFSASYTENCVKIGEENPAIVTGFVSQSRVSKDPTMLQFTPGVHISLHGDKQDQRYTSPVEAVLGKGADLVIVGRGVTEGTDPRAEADKYREKAWEAYLSRVEALD